MALSTRFTGLFGLRHPIALAPMGGSAGGALAAAVSRAGGLGLLGAGSGDREWLEREVAILAGRGQDTERSSVLDVVRGSRWPSQYPARTLGHPHLDRWRGRGTELAGDPRAAQDYRDDVARGVVPALPVRAGEGVDLVTDLPPAGELVGTLAAGAEDALARAGRR